MASTRFGGQVVTLFAYAYSAVSDCIDKVLQTVCDGDQQLQEQ
jgi:hypothetical protein